MDNCNTSAVDTSKMDLSEIQEENAIQEPVKNLQAAERCIPQGQNEEFLNNT